MLYDLLLECIEAVSSNGNPCACVLELKSSDIGSGDKGDAI